MEIFIRAGISQPHVEEKNKTTNQNNKIPLTYDSNITLMQAKNLF